MKEKLRIELTFMGCTVDVERKYEDEVLKIVSLLVQNGVTIFEDSIIMVKDGVFKVAQIWFMDGTVVYDLKEFEPFEKE